VAFSGITFWYLNIDSIFSANPPAASVARQSIRSGTAESPVSQGPKTLPMSAVCYIESIEQRN